jgi:hypothetical protein
MAKIAEQAERYDGKNKFITRYPLINTNHDHH